MIIYDESELYPLREDRIFLGEEPYTNRANRGKSWFILDLALFEEKFVPRNSSGLRTIDGDLFTTVSTRRGTNWYE